MKYLSVKRIDLFLFLAVILVLTFVAVNHCKKPVNSFVRTSIFISMYCEDLFGRDNVNAFIQEFEEQNPDLQIQKTNRENADIVFLDDGELNKLINDSALASLAPYTDTEAVYWALPLVSFMDLFLYNIDILEKANCDRPPKTRAEFLAVAKAVAESNSASSEQVSAFALGLSPTDMAALRRNIYPWIWANGGDLSSVDVTDENAALPREITDTIAFMGQLHSEGLLAPETFEKTRQMRLEEFAEGKIAMMTASARDIVFLRRNAEGANSSVNFGITAIPVTAYGKNRLGLSCIYAGISSACAVPDEAWTFLAFLAEKNNLLAEAISAVPGSYPSAFPGEYITEDPLHSKVWEIFEAADIVEHQPGQPFEEEINRIIREKLVEVLN